MFIEAVESPVRYCWPEGEIRLEPGKPVQIADEGRALKVLARCWPSVRPISFDWEEQWRDLAELTLGITTEDPRFLPILQALERCDWAFMNGDLSAFCQAAEKVNSLVKNES